MAEDRLMQVELQLIAQVGAAKRLGSPAAAAAPATEDVAENLAEDVAELLATEAALTARTAALARSLDALVAVLVVDRALLRVGQDFVRLLRFLEVLLGLSVALWRRATPVPEAVPA